MWEVTLTARNPADPAELADTTVRIYSDDPRDLLKNEHFRWATLETMMDRGSLARILVDYRPNYRGTRRIKRGDDGLFRLFVDGIQYGEGHETPEQAWAEGEGIVRSR